MANKYDFDLIKGEDFSKRIVIRDSSLNYKNLSGYYPICKAKYLYCNESYLINFNPIIYNYQSGIIDLFLGWTGTENLPVTKVNYDLNLFLSGDALSENVLYGKINIYPNILN